VDAAIAAAAVLTIVEPVSCGLGSDAFCILWDGKALHGLNASGRAPQAWTPEYFQKKYGPDAMQPPKRGIDSVTVPGAVASWVAMSERFGKLPFADLMQSAIEIAERGYLLSVVVQEKWAAPVEELRHQPGFSRHFCLGAVRRKWVSCSSFPQPLAAYAPLPTAKAKRFMAVKSPMHWRSFPMPMVAA
jgi:gamma-glutamyltranspeptidase / glutathione hydrolase